MFREGFPYDLVPIELRERSDGLLLTFRWMKDTHLFGLHIPFEGAPVLAPGVPSLSPHEWAWEVEMWLSEELGTGMVYRSRRTAVDDYLLLEGPDRPVDGRFFASEFDAPTDGWWIREHGFDTALPLARRDEGQLISWLVTYVNNRRGEPLVGQAVVSWQEDSTARLELLTLVPGLPVTAALDLAQSAIDMASSAGATRVITDVNLKELVALGFLPTDDGALAVDTSFLDTKPVELERMFERELALRLPRSVTWGPGSFTKRLRRRLFTRTLTHAPPDTLNL